MINIEHLKKEYDGVTPLKDINVTINKGDVVSIIGPSGTGKSTLLRCINLLETPTSGNIIIDGDSITDKDADVFKIRQKLGMVFQTFNLFNNLTVLDNVTVAPISVLKKNKDEAESEAMEYLKLVGLAEKANAYPKELSGGQKQRVAIARSIAMNPKVMLFDEPTSALDPTMVGEVELVIKKLAKENMTMMIVTHELDFAKEVSNRILYLDEGIVYEDGPPEQIFDNPKHDKTRIFINNIKAVSKTLTSKDFDNIEMQNNIRNFCNHYFINKSVCNICQVIFESANELLFEDVNYDGELNVQFEYSDKEKSIYIKFDFLYEEVTPDDVDLVVRPYKFKGVTRNYWYDKNEGRNYCEFIVSCKETVK